MHYQTIRRNNLKAIRKLLTEAVLIKDCRDDGQDATAQEVTVESVLELSGRFKQVYTDAHGILTISCGGSHTITAYPDIAAAKHALTPQAFAKYFPVDPMLERHRIEVGSDFPRAAEFVDWLDRRGHDAVVSSDATDTHSYVDNADTSRDIDASNLLISLWKEFWKKYYLR